MNTIALMQEAMTCERRGDIAGAAAGYRKLLAREPDNVDALFLLGRACCLQGRFEDAARYLGQVVALQSGLAPAHNLLGMALVRGGRPREALAAFQRALDLGAPDAVALMHMADAFGTLGRHAEAVAAFDRALALDAGNVVAWCNRGLALETLGRDAEAAESFERALALAPDLPEIHFNLANALQRLQRHEDAVTHYRRAIALRPELARAHANLVGALFALERWAEVIEAVERAVPFQPDLSPLYDAKGMALWHLDRHEESLASFDKALALDPRNAAALNNKGRLLYILGRLDEARGLIEQALALDPGHLRSYLDIGEVKRFTAGDPQIAALERLLPDIETRPQDDRIFVHFALAKAYRDIGRHAQSFEQLLRGNALKRSQLDYVEDGTIHSQDRIREIFTPDLMTEKSGQGDPSILPVFVIGMPRSGTTLVEQILASHPRIHGAGERRDFQEAVASLGPLGRYPETVPAMTADHLQRIGAAYVARLSALAPAAERITDKMPANHLYAGLIHLALPRARIIHVQRDPIDTCLSCFSTLFSQPQAFAYDLGELGRYYRAYERLMQHWREVLPAGVMLEVRYEDVVDDTEAEARRVVAHCGLEWNAACLAFHELDRPVQTASAAQVRRPIYRTSIERWRAYEDRLGPLLEALERSG